MYKLKLREVEQCLSSAEEPAIAEELQEELQKIRHLIKSLSDQKLLIEEAMAVFNHKEAEQLNYK